MRGVVLHSINSSGLVIIPGCNLQKTSCVHDCRREGGVVCWRLEVVTGKETSPSGVDVCASRRQVLQERSSMPVFSFSCGDASAKSVGVSGDFGVCWGERKVRYSDKLYSIVPCSSHIFLYPVFF